MGTRVSYALNGLQLDVERFRVVVGSTWYAGVTTRRSVTTVKGRHGTVVGGMIPRFEDREATISVVAWGDDRDRTVERFLRLCTMPVLELSKTVESRDGTRTMRTRVELTSLQPDGDERPASTSARFTAVFAMPDVWWTSPERMLQQLPAEGGMLLPPAGPADNEAGYWTMPLGIPDDSPSLLYTDMPDGWLSGAPITDLILRLPACDSATVTDPVSGTNLTWSGTKPSGYLYLDSAGLRAWSSSSGAAWTGGTDQTAHLDYQGEPLEVWPAVDGSYTLDIQSTGDGEPVASFRQAWW